MQSRAGFSYVVSVLLALVIAISLGDNVVEHDVDAMLPQTAHNDATQADARYEYSIARLEQPAQHLVVQ